MLECSARWIAITSHVLNLASIVCLLASLLTNRWLLTEERIPELASAPSVVFTMMGPKQTNLTYRVQQTFSGLWNFCMIEHATIISMPSLLSATAVTLIGMITNVLMKFRKIWIFVTGVIYITAGIFTFTCLVLYITYIMQELDHKKDEKGEDGESLFSLSYGYSVILAMVSFCCQELGGVGLIYLSIARFRAHWDAKDQQLAQRTLEFNLNNARFPPCISVPLPAQPFPACQPNFHGHTSRQGRHGSLEQIQMHAPLHGNTPNWHTRSTTHSSTCSPRLHRKSMTDPDLDVRTRDMYIGNHINCSYNSTYRTPFGLDLAPKSIYEKPRQPRRERTMLFAKTAPRQVTFSDEELDVVMDSYSGSSLRSNVPQSAGGLPPRRIRRALRTESLRMTPV